MNRGFASSQQSDSAKHSNPNQGALDEAEQNYFMKYANSGYSQANNTQRFMKKTQTKVTTRQNAVYNTVRSTQNDVLRQLKQQYQILRNLPVQERVQVKSKPKRQITSEYSSSIDDRSDMTSSKRSNRRGGRDAQILALEKKQLEVVISNSMRKIQQLLTNQMQLKKTIHELRLQVDGKGGANSEYQIAIKNFKRNEKELNQSIETLKTQIERKNAAIKQLGEKVAYLEGQRSRRDTQSRNFYEERRALQETIRKQKDRFMNSELQIKKLQMEMEIMQKDKNSEISRLTRQLEANSQIPDRDAETIKRLHEQLRSKQNRYDLLLEQMDHLRQQINTLNSRPRSPPPPPQQVQRPPPPQQLPPPPQQILPPPSLPPQQPVNENKIIIEELIRTLRSKSQSNSKENNESIVKVLFDKLGNRQDDGLKNQLSSLRIQLENLKNKPQSVETPKIINPPSHNLEPQLRMRIKELQKCIQQERRQRRSLLQKIDKFDVQSDDYERQIEEYKRKVRQLQDQKDQLQRQLQRETDELNVLKNELEESQKDTREIKSKLETVLIQHQKQSQVKRDIPIDNPHQKRQIQGLHDQIRNLRRKIQQLNFALDKARQEKVFSQNILKEAQAKQIARLTQGSDRYKNLLKSKQQQMIRVVQSLRIEIQAKDSQLQSMSKNYEQIESRNKQGIQGVRTNYEQMLKASVSKHYTQLETMNRNLIQVTKMSQGYASQNQKLAYLERQVIELRRMNRNNKRVNEALDHLWEIKQAQYGNINQLLNGVRN